MIKKLISLLLSIVLLFGIGAETFAAVSEAHAETSYVTVDCTNKVDISYEITEQQGGSFTAEISITNKSDEPISGWQLSFKGNFGISSIQNANNLSSKNEFRIENNASDQPIAKGETKKFEFQGVIVPGETPVLSDFVLTSVVPDSDKVQPHMIMCFGAYIDEEDSLEIYWFSTDEGAVSLYENTDDGGWENLAELTDEKSYKHKIGEGFLEKQIKAVQETTNGTLESEPFIVAHKGGKIVCEWLDNDDDGLADFAEKTLGTDSKNPDTDGDGLTDYEELYITGTDPLKSDTNGNGVNDADDDLDGDGLSNKKEISLGTSPISADTDEDGLSDSDEINKHKTDPLKTDSDGDGLNDGEEIAIGLNPNKPETFGMPDSEYKVKQTISADSEAMSRVNTEESPYELSLEISATGNASTRLSANDSAYSTVTESDARLGGAVELRYLGEVDKVKLTYKIADEYIPNESSEYAENCDELQGIKRYNIFRYFEEINMLLPVETKVDEESNTLSAETDELGTYCVLDMEVLMRNFGIEPEEVSAENVEVYSSVLHYSMPMPVEPNPQSNKYCVTFVIDKRKDSFTSEQLDYINVEILSFTQEVRTYKPNTEVKTITQGSSWFGSYVVTENIDEIVNSSDPNVTNYIFEIYSQNDAVFEQNTANELLTEAKKKGIKISIVSPSKASLSGFQADLAKDTEGLVINDLKNFNFSTIYNHVYGKPLPEQDFYAVLASGYQLVKLNGRLNAFNGIDTDGDTLSDWDEVDINHWVECGLITYDSNNEIVLPTLGKCIGFVEKPYVNEGLGRISWYYVQQLWEKSVLPIISDPTREDSDGDGLLDGKSQSYKNKMIAPKDNSPLMYDGPKNAWINHIETSKNSMVTEYSSGFGSTGSEVVNKFLTVIDNTVNVEFDTIDSKILHVDFSVDVEIKIHCSAIKPLLELMGKFMSEVNEYIHTGSQRDENSLWISLEVFNNISSRFNPCFEINPEQLDEFVYEFCEFIDENYKYIEPFINYESNETLDIKLIALSKEFEINADTLVDLGLRVAPIINENSAVFNKIFTGIKEICEGNTALGARALNFVLDDKGVAYHSLPKTWQRAFGYNDLYDLAFEIGSYMDNVRYNFESGEKKYALWMWKGDYWNLQSGAEIGLYYIDNNRHQISEADHYYCMNYELPMSLSLYNCNDYGGYENIFCWYPNKEQWWITGFNAHTEFMEPNHEKMVVIGSIDFSSKTVLYDDFKKETFDDKANLENYFYFDDDNYILWILWTQGERREYNFELKKN